MVVYKIALSIICTLCSALFSYNMYNEKHAGHKGGAVLMGILSVCAIVCICMMIFVSV